MGVALSGVVLAEAGDMMYDWSRLDAGWVHHESQRGHYLETFYQGELQRFYYRESYGMTPFGVLAVEQLRKCLREVNDSGCEINDSAHEVNGPSESGVASIELGGRKLTWSDVTVTIGGREILSAAG